jgi:hypothetical protein
MKTTLVLFAVIAAVGCANLRQVQQVDMVQAKVIRIDTLYRYPEHLKQLTWKDKDDIQYISYVSIYNENYEIGSSMYVMRRR